AIGECHVKEARPTHQEADHGDDENRLGAEDVDRQNPVVDRRPEKGTRQGECHRCEQGGGSGGKHQRAVSLVKATTRRSMSPSSRASAPSRVSECTMSESPSTRMVTVPGVRVMELA